MTTAVDAARSDDGGASEEPSWLTRLIRLRRDGDDTFVAERPASPQGRLFGGLVAAQALAAACATVGDGKLPQSLHLYFVRPGAPGVDIGLEVARTRDGRSFDTRRVTARQGGEIILEMVGSFHLPEPGVDHHPPPPPHVDLDTAVVWEAPDELGEHFEIRVPRVDAMFTGPPYWIRSHAAVEDDPLTRACALAYMSDIALMAAARPPDTSLVFERVFAASLDHSIWFHRPFHPERWHYYQAASVNNNDSCGLAIGAFYTENGTLVATLAQEALWRM